MARKKREGESERVGGSGKSQEMQGAKGVGSHDIRDFMLARFLPARFHVYTRARVYIQRDREEAKASALLGASSFFLSSSCALRVVGFLLLGAEETVEGGG